MTPLLRWVCRGPEDARNYRPELERRDLVEKTITVHAVKTKTRSGESWKSPITS